MAASGLLHCVKTEMNPTQKAGRDAEKNTDRETGNKEERHMKRDQEHTEAGGRGRKYCHTGKQHLQTVDKDDRVSQQ